MSNMGRPKKPIDWEKVKDLCIAGCSGTEIAPHFDMHPDTLYLRCEEVHGMTFTAFSAKFAEKGVSLLRAQQFAKAMGKTDKGDNTLLIWLGKVRCGQSEKKVELSNDDITDIANYFATRRKLPGISQPTEPEVETE